MTKHKYTSEELLEALIADMEIDLACAERDNLSEYAERVRQELAALRANNIPKHWQRYLV